MRVLIAGGGIGGLAFAAAAQRAGLTCEVYERAPELRPIGAGITVQMNAILALASAGLDGPVRAAGLAPSRAEIRLPSGRLLQTLDLAAIAREVGAPGYTITRARLHQALLDQLAPGTVRTGAAVERFTQDDRGVTITTASGTATGDVLVGADGLRSAVRAQLVGDGEPRYAGYGAWRALVRADVDPDVVIETWGAGLRFGIVPVGKGEVYMFGVANLPAGSQPSKADLASRFAGWHDPIPALIDRATDILYTDIADREPRTTWTNGRVAMLGDAIHPMTPNLGQGGGQAIEDAIVLARCLAESDVPAAFARYEAKRVSRANAVVVESRRAGAIMQLENPALRAVRDVALRLTPMSLTRRRVVAAMRFRP